MPSVRDVWIFTVSQFFWLLPYPDLNAGNPMAPECPSKADSLRSHFHTETGHCYYVIDGRLLFEEARSKCQGDSHLVQLETEEEQTWLDTVYGSDTWLGILGDGSTFHWITTSETVSTSDPRWLTGTVGTRVAKQSDGKWAKTSEFNGHGVICEMDSIPVVDSPCSENLLNKDNREFTFSLSTTTNLKTFLSIDTRGPIACGLDCLKTTRCVAFQVTPDSVCRLLETSTELLTCEGCYIINKEC